MSADLHRALTERSDRMEARAAACLSASLGAKEVWTKHLGVAPRGSMEGAWRQFGRTVAAYRDRYAIISASALDPPPQSTAHHLDWTRAREALEGAQRLVERNSVFDGPGKRTRSGLSTSGIRI